MKAISCLLSITFFLVGCDRKADDQAIVPKSEEEPVVGDTSPAHPVRVLPSGDCREVVGEGNWRYTWPHDLLPNTICGFVVKSTPIDNSLNNRGKTKSNWGKPVVYETGNGKLVTVWCKRDYGKERLGWATECRSVFYEQTDFHDLKA